MIVLSDLTGNGAVGTWNETHGILSTVLDEPITGFFRQVQLGTAGLTVKNGGNSVGIPLALILELAQTLCPALTPPQTSPVVSAAAPAAARPAAVSTPLGSAAPDAAAASPATPVKTQPAAS
jgi:hypothetical protein